ncbi:hypothetical protein J1779_15175 [Rahnella sp. FC061912-K]|uniref:hypothetical protein n=1 Tax=Rahnella rivi TaxID=2816249 RepID=UPI001C252C82|nr:hypothetical protein [Rahnella rivi]MBU9831277.1 hypothetical protein [Rahnella rivi]
MKTGEENEYHYPCTDAYSEQVHTTKGVTALKTGSNIERLLLQLYEKGYDISGAMTELKALLNYVTDNQEKLRDIETHLMYLLQKARSEM